MSAHVLLNLLNELGKSNKFHTFFLTINSLFTIAIRPFAC